MIFYIYIYIYIFIYIYMPREAGRGNAPHQSSALTAHLVSPVLLLLRLSEEDNLEELILNPGQGLGSHGCLQSPSMLLCPCTSSSCPCPSSPCIQGASNLFLLLNPPSACFSPCCNVFCPCGTLLSVGLPGDADLCELLLSSLHVDQRCTVEVVSGLEHICRLEEL